MISWIQKYFQRHFRLVFVMILVAMGVPLVVIYSQSSGIGRAGPQSRQHQLFFGANLGNETEAARIFADADRSVVFRLGYPALQGSQREQYALNRVAGLALADQLHLPAPNKEQIAAFVAKLPIFQNDKGQFDPDRYKQFGESLKSTPQFSTADANRVLRDDTRLEQLQKLIGGPGYALPAEVREQLVANDTSWTIQVASFDYKSFEAGVTVTDEALAKFYEENSFRYMVPDQAKLSLIEFPAAAYMPAGSPTDEQLRALYDQNPARFPAPPEEKKAEDPKLTLNAAPPATPAPDDQFAKVRPQVEAAFRQAASMDLAAKAANTFTIALYERKVAANSAELEAFLASQNIRAVALPAFAPDHPPADYSWLSGSANETARLGRDNNRFFSDAIRTPTGFAVLLWNATLPSYQPKLADVREKVTVDFVEDAKRKRFIERGNSLQTSLQAAVKSGASFEKAATDAKLDVKSYASFTLRQPPQDFPYQALSGLQTLAAGEVSPMTSTEDKGLIAYVQDKKLPAFDAASSQATEIRSQMMRINSSSTQRAYLDDLIAAELKKSGPAPTL